MKDGAPIQDPMIPGESLVGVVGEPQELEMCMLGAQLTPRQTEVMLLRAQGLSYRRIAEELNIGMDTIKTHAIRAHEKLGVETTTEMLLRASEMGLINTAELVDSGFDPNVFDLLTQRQKEIVDEIVQGFTDKEVAKKLGITEDTIGNHLWKIYTLTKLKGRVILALGYLEAKRRAGEQASEGKSLVLVDSEFNSSVFDRLTRREREIADKVAQGLTDREVASELSISPQTVKNTLQKIYLKTKFKGRICLTEGMLEVREKARLKSSEDGDSSVEEIQVFPSIKSVE